MRHYGTTSRAIRQIAANMAPTAGPRRWRRASCVGDLSTCLVGRHPLCTEFLEARKVVWGEASAQTHCRSNSLPKKTIRNAKDSGL